MIGLLFEYEHYCIKVLSWACLVWYALLSNVLYGISRGFFFFLSLVAPEWNKPFSCTKNQKQKLWQKHKTELELELLKWPLSRTKISIILNTRGRDQTLSLTKQMKRKIHNTLRHWVHLFGRDVPILLSQIKKMEKTQLPMISSGWTYATEFLWKLRCKLFQITWKSTAGD